MPLVRKLRLPLPRRHVVGCPRSAFDFVPTYHGFVRAVVFLARTYDGLRLYSICLHNLRNSFVLFGNDYFRLDILYLLG